MDNITGRRDYEDSRTENANYDEESHDSEDNDSERVPKLARHSCGMYLTFFNVIVNNKIWQATRVILNYCIRSNINLS